MVWFAFSLQAQVEKYGAYVGIAAFFGLAVLTVLYFSQARELKRLREWAGRAPERARELEQRVVTQATAAVSRRPAATPLPQRPAPPRRLAEMPPPATGAAAEAAATGQATELAEAVPADPATNGNVPTAPGGSVPATPAPANGATLPADAVEPNGDGASEEEPAEQPDPEAAEAPATPEPAADAPAPEEPGHAPVAGAAEAAPDDAGEDDAGDEEAAVAAVPRATPAQRPAPPRPAPMPLRQSQPSAAARRPTQPAARRPAKPPREGRSGGTIALLFGVAVLILGGGAFAISQLGGSDTPPKPNQPAQPATQSPDATQGSGTQGTSTTPPSETNVAVLNGTTFNGLAGQIQDRVAQQGFQRGTKATNLRDQSVQASIVYYADGFRTQARRVGRLLSVTAVKPLDAETRALAPQADVVVLAGADQAP